MAGSLITFVAVLCASAAHGAATEYSKLKIVALKRMLFVRGVECTHCTSKGEWVAHMQLHSELPEREELAAEWVAQKEYAKKAKELSMTRDEFLKQMNETEGARAERLWAVHAHPTHTRRTLHAHATHTRHDVPHTPRTRHAQVPHALRARHAHATHTIRMPCCDVFAQAFQEQLRDGHVEFLENGSIRFSMPLTHRIAPFLHPALVDAIEWVAAQWGYRRVPRQWRQQIEALLDWAVESGALHAAVVVLFTVILLDVLLESRSQRRDDQLDERAEQVLRQLKAGRAGGSDGAAVGGTPAAECR